MQHKYKFLFICLILLISSITLFSQENKKPIRILVNEDVVFPYKAMEYESAQKAFNEFFKKNKIDFKWRTYQTDDFKYRYVVQFTGLGEVDDLFKMWGEKIKAAGQNEFNKLMSAFAGTIDRSNSSVVELKDSYDPANPTVKPDEIGFLHWDLFEIVPGRENEAASLVTEYKKLNEKLKIRVPYKQWSVVFGQRSSTVIFTTPAKDEVDFYTHNKETDDMMMKDPEGSEMYMKFMSKVRSFEHYNGKPRPDLSLTDGK